MSGEERDAFREKTETELRENMDAFAGVLANQARQEGFLATFSMFDLLFFGLAIMTAWQIASGGGSD